MGQFRETQRIVNLVPGVLDRCWDEPCSVPFKTINVSLSSNAISFPASNISWRLLLGGNWTGGSPYDYGTTMHSGGEELTPWDFLSSGSTVAHIVYNNISVRLGSNRFNSNRQADPQFYGLPLVLELENTTKGIPVTLYITFLTETIGTNV